MRRACARIHLDHLTHNLRAIRRRVGSRPAVCLAVKASAYGHGAVQVARAAIEAGVTWLAVATSGEASELRAAGITVPILLLGIPVPDEAEALVEMQVSCIVADERLVELYARSAERIGTTARLHLLVDTGMGRIGCSQETAPTIADEIRRRPHIALEGLCTHFPDADAPDPTFTAHQIRRFTALVNLLTKDGHRPPYVHAANSAGIAGFESSHFTMVRPGIAAYGYEPHAAHPLGLRPVMEFVSTVVFVKRVPAGTPISYGRTYITPCDTRIATVAAGYGDGYARLLSNRAEVLIRKHRYPIAGRVCMDQFMVDIGLDSDVGLHDQVTLFGPDPAGPDAAELAHIIGTIPYEVLCAVSPRVPRVTTGSPLVGP